LITRPTTTTASVLCLPLFDKSVHERVGLHLPPTNARPWNLLGPRSARPTPSRHFFSWPSSSVDPRRPRGRLFIDRTVEPCRRPLYRVLKAGPPYVPSPSHPQLALRRHAGRTAHRCRYRSRWTVLRLFEGCDVPLGSGSYGDGRFPPSKVYVPSLPPCVLQLEPSESWPSCFIFTSGAKPAVQRRLSSSIATVVAIHRGECQRSAGFSPPGDVLACRHDAPRFDIAGPRTLLPLSGCRPAIIASARRCTRRRAAGQRLIDEPRRHNCSRPRLRPGGFFSDDTGWPGRPK